MNKKKIITIFGASGCGNVGDDLIGVTLKEYLEKKIDNVEVVLTQQHKREYIMASDIVIIGGGGLIYDYVMENVDNYIDIILRAKHLGIPTYMLGMGVQHVFSVEAKKKYEDAFKNLDMIETRGERDSKIIRDDFYYNGRLVTGSDIVFLLKDSVRLKKEHHDKPKILLSLADWKLGNDTNNKIDPKLEEDYKAYREYLRKELPKIKDDFDFIIVNQAVEDLEFSKELVELTGGRYETFETIEDSKRLLDIYSEADAVLTGRYHGMIAAILTRKPVLAVSFKGHKQHYLAKELFPSLVDQTITVGDFVRERKLDSLCSLINSDKFGTSSELRKAYKKAKEIDLAVRDIELNLRFITSPESKQEEK